MALTASAMGSPEHAVNSQNHRSTGGRGGCTHPRGRRARVVWRGGYRPVCCPGASPGRLQGRGW
eukprot:6704981-Alexandrium_andersonii.AAC.1